MSDFELFLRFLSDNILWIVLFGSAFVGAIFKGLKSLLVDPWFRKLELRTKIVKEERKTEELKAKNLDKELELEQLKLQRMQKEEENLLLGSKIEQKALQDQIKKNLES